MNTPNLILTVSSGKREVYKSHRDTIRYICHVCNEEASFILSAIRKQGSFVKETIEQTITVRFARGSKRRRATTSHPSTIAYVWATNADLRHAFTHRLREDPLAEKALLKARIDQHAELICGEWMVAIAYSGVDCDMARWDDRVAYVPAYPSHVTRWIERYHEGAEGPQWTRIERPSIAAMLQPSSRDLALEAREDGHDHVVYL